jgi:tRNA1(Val) A37 N6-methylase TrmN6
MPQLDPQQLATELLAARGQAALVIPPLQQHDHFALLAAYRVAAEQLRL